MKRSEKKIRDVIVGYVDAFGRIFCTACISNTVACAPVYTGSRPRAFEPCKTCRIVLQHRFDTPNPAKVWHGFVVLNELGEVLGVYGSAIRSMADSLAQRLREQFPGSKIEVAPVELPFRPAIGAMVKR